MIGQLFRKSYRLTLVAFCALNFLPQNSEACTRVLFSGLDDIVITARSMDWAEDMHSDLWIFPKGMERNGAAGPQSLAWKSKYGSLIVAGYNVGSCDGMNEMGLVANLLYLAESDYGKPAGKKPLLSIAAWQQYVLDMFSSVSEAVVALSKEEFDLLAPKLPNGSAAQLHLSISDKNGDSAIFEYINGELVIHHGKQYQVMTNSPIFSKQLTLNEYWKVIGGLTFLPGTFRAADRFARASFMLSAIPQHVSKEYISAVPNKNFVNQALASMMGVIRSVSVPLGISTPNEPNISSTLWRTLSDHKGKVYYFDSATTPNTFWVELKDLDFSEGASVKKLKVSDGQIYAGNVAEKFEISEPFTFLPANN